MAVKAEWKRPPACFANTIRNSGALKVSVAINLLHKLYSYVFVEGENASLNDRSRLYLALHSRPAAGPH